MTIVLALCLLCGTTHLLTELILDADIEAPQDTYDAIEGGDVWAPPDLPGYSSDEDNKDGQPVDEPGGDGGSDDEQPGLGADEKHNNHSELRETPKAEDEAKAKVIVCIDCNGAHQSA